MKKGYTVVPLLSDDEVAYILKEIEQLKPDDKFSPSGDGVYHVSYHCTFIDTNFDYKRQANKLIREVFMPHVNRLLVDHEILTCNFFVKQYGKGRMNVHQNWPALADLKDTSVTVWCPLVDVDETNGTIQFVEGSHKIVPHISGPICDAYCQDFQEELIEHYLKPISLKAGEAVIFDDELLHWSADNLSAKPRFAVHLLCVPSDAKKVFYYLDQKESKQFEVFEVDSEFFLRHSITDLLNRPADAKSLGFVENKNRILSKEEFDQLLKNGDEIRRAIYFPEEATKPNTKISLLKRMRASLGI